MALTKCGPIPGLEDETKQILSVNRLDFDTDEECLHHAEQLAARLQWTIKAE